MGGQRHRKTIHAARRIAGCRSNYRFRVQPGSGGTGSALITVNRGQQEVCWHISASNIALPATASHIHKAAPGVQGPIALNLAPPAENDGSWSACKSPPDVNRTVVEEIVENPGAYYVNVHNTVYPPGAVGGQLGQ